MLNISHVTLVALIYQCLTLTAKHFRYAARCHKYLDYSNTGGKNSYLHITALCRVDRKSPVFTLLTCTSAQKELGTATCVASYSLQHRAGRLPESPERHSLPKPTVCVAPLSCH